MHIKHKTEQVEQEGRFNGTVLQEVVNIWRLQ